MIYPDFYPFYATQGSPGFYNEEREQEKEFDLMRSYYPDTARRIQEKAEAQCQLLDYEGSRLYDEYPDRFMLYHICHQVKGQMEGDTSVQYHLHSMSWLFFREQRICFPFHAASGHVL